MSWQIGIEDLDALAIGAAILGTGGGGDPYIGRVMAETAIRENGSVTVYNVDDLDDDRWVIPIAGMGAPTVLLEKVPRGTEPVAAFRRLEDHLGVQDAFPCPIEAGGINSMVPLQVAALLKRPVVDADGMGRAFPALYMQTFHIFGIQGTPACIASEFDDFVILDHLHDNYALEWIARGITIRMGGHTFLSQFPMRGHDVKRSAIRGTLSLGLRIGKAVLLAEKNHRDPLEAVCEATHYAGYGRGQIVFSGKIVEVSRRTADGFARGKVRIQGLNADRDQSFEIEFQNENLLIRHEERILAMVPDLITVLDSHTGLAVTTERLRYGQRVAVLVIPAPAIMKSPEALQVWGPRGFDYDFDYEKYFGR
jgi:DUF917 family protein